MRILRDVLGAIITTIIVFFQCQYVLWLMNMKVVIINMR